MNWDKLDSQMARFEPQLREHVKIQKGYVGKLVTVVASEVRFLSQEAKLEIRNTSPVPIEDRFTELVAFQGWMDISNTNQRNPCIARAQVLTQNYICFIYLPESCFRVLYKVLPSGSTTKRCCKFLINSRVRSFRNAIAHANWTYRQDFRAIQFWARKGEDKDEPLIQFEVEQGELEFWQALSRCVAYAAYSNLR